jgi:hypothetical protein
VVAFVIAAASGHGPGKPAAGSSSSGPLAPVTVTPPPSNAASEQPCAKVVGSLPLRLAGQNVRATATNPASPFVVAWGNPAIVLRCGVNRPAAMVPTTPFVVVDTVNFLVVRSKTQTVWTAVDRAAFIEVTVPNSYSQPPMGPIADVIAKELPAVCGTPEVPVHGLLCTHRK